LRSFAKARRTGEAHQDSHQSAFAVADPHPQHACTNHRQSPQERCLSQSPSQSPGTISRLPNHPRKRFESIFGWVKVIGGLRKLTCIGLPAGKGPVAWTFTAYNLVRLGQMDGWWDPAPT